MPTMFRPARRRSFTRLARRVGAAACLALALGVSMGCADGIDVPGAESATEGVVVPSNGNYFQRWVPLHMTASGADITDAVARNAAQRGNLVISTPARLSASEIASMRTVNPSVRVLVYENGSFSDSATAYPENYYAHDAGGRRIKSLSWGNYLMEVSNPAWIADVVRQCNTDIAASRFDGCYLDMMGDAPLRTAYVTSLPINPATRQVWTERDWMAQMTRNAAAVKTGINGRPLAGNGLGGGNAYFTNSGTLVLAPGALDVGHSETWLRRGATSSLTSFLPEARWLEDVRMLGDAERHGRQVMAQVKIWNSASTADIARWRNYSVASFLLGTEGQSFYSLSTGRTVAGVFEDDPIERLDVGTPAAPTAQFAKVGGVYQRTFTRGIALVNPTTATVSVTLPGAYRTPAGASVTQLTMGPNTGAVLTK